MPDPAHVGQALGSMTSSPTPGIHATPMQWMTQADLLSRISDISSGGTPVQLVELSKHSERSSGPRRLSLPPNIKHGAARLSPKRGLIGRARTAFLSSCSFLSKLTVSAGTFVARTLGCNG